MVQKITYSLSSFIKGSFLATFTLFSFGQLGRILFFEGNATLYLYEIPLLALLILLFTAYQHKPIAEIIRNIRSIPIFIAVVFVTLLISFFNYSIEHNIIAFLYFLRLTFYFLFFVYFSYFCIKEKNLLGDIKYPLLFPIGVIIVSSIGQYFLYPDLRNIFYLGWDPHLYRVFGTFFEPVIAASIFGLISIFLFLNSEAFKNKALVYCSVILLEILLLMTYARSAIIAMSAVVASYFLRKNILYLLIAGIILILALMLIPKKSGEGVNLFRTSTIYSRLVDYQQGWQLFIKKPLQGIGYNHIRYEKLAKKGDHAAASFHSSFLVILVTAGILGLLSFVYFLFELTRLNIFATFSVVFLSIVSFFDNVLLHPFILFMLFSFVALSNRPSGSGQ